MTSTFSEAMLVRKGMQKLKDTFPDAWIIKTADRMTRGIPDVLAVIVHGSAVVVCCLEFKTERGRVSGIQQITLDRLQRLADQVYEDVAWDLVHTKSLRTLRGVWCGKR